MRTLIVSLTHMSVISHFLLDFLVSFFNPIGPYLITKFGIEIRVLTTFLTLSAAFSSLMQVLFGFWFDKVHSTKSYLITMYFLEAFGIALLGFSTNFWVALIAVLIIRLANSAFHPLGAAMAGESSGRSVAIFSIAGTLGAAIGPVFISFYVSRLSIEALWIVSIPFLVIGIYMLGTKLPLKAVKLNPKFSFKEIFVLIPILFVVTTRSFIMSIVHTYTPIYITSILNYHITLSGMLITSGMIAGVFANYLGVLLMEKIGAKKQDLIAFLGMAISIIIFLSTKSIFLLFLSFITFDFCGFLLMSANIVQAQKILPTRKALASSVSMGFAWSIGDFTASGY
ncbi:MAG: MFS transporter, partial [Fervidobacterium sp.]